MKKIIQSREAYLLYCFLLTLLFGFWPIEGFDAWWHLAGGLWSLDNHAVPLKEFFSFTRGGAPWLNHEWGAGVFFALFTLVFGGFGLVVLKLLLLFGTLYLTGRSVQLLSVSKRIPYEALFVTAFLLLPRLQNRPHLFSCFFLAILIHEMIVLERGQLSRIRWALLAVVFLVWTNVHWGVLLAFGLLGLFTLGKWIESKKFPSSLSCLVLVAALMMLANPFTYQVFTFPFDHLEMRNIMQGTMEWRSPLHMPWRGQWAYQVLFVLMLLNWFLVLLKTYRFQFSRTLIFLPVTYLALAHNRYIDLFVLTCLPFICQRLEEKAGRIPRLLGQMVFAVALLVALIWHGCKITRWMRDDFAKSGWVAPAYNFSHGSAFIADNFRYDHVFHHFELGGYLMLEGVKVFMDGRTPIYGDEFFGEYLRALNEWPVFQNLVADWDIGVVWLIYPYQETNLPYQLIQSGNWVPVYKDDLSIIFIDKRSSHADILKKTENGKKLFSAASQP